MHNSLIFLVTESGRKKFFRSKLEFEGDIATTTKRFQLGSPYQLSTSTNVCYKPRVYTRFLFEENKETTIKRFQISAAYMSNYPSGSTELTCSVCSSRGQEAGKVYKSFYAIIVHLGSRHNCILDFAEEPLKAQLLNFNVYKN